MNNFDIGIIGFGSVGKLLYNNLLDSGYSNERIYIFADDAVSVENRNFSFNDYKLQQFRHLHFVPALGYLSKKIKMDVLNYLIENNYEVFSFVHPTAYVSKRARIGKGVIVYSMANIDQGSEIGDGTIICNSTVIAHDTKIGKCCYISPSACINGYIEVEDLCFLGSLSIVANTVKIGRNSTVAIGTCLTKSIPENSFVIGNPFQFKQNLKLV